MKADHKIRIYKCLPTLLVVFIGFILCADSVAAQNKPGKGGAVCGDASKPECTKNDSIFKPYSLVFKFSPKAAKDPQQYAEGEQSEYFYAVLLETVKGYKPDNGCREISEAKISAAQGMFPNNKVFAYQYYCENVGEGDQFLEYEFTGNNDSIHLLAVYGGANQTEAAKILNQAKKKYPKARIVKMRAIVVVQYDV